MDIKNIRSSQESMEGIAAAKAKVVRFGRALLEKWSKIFREFKFYSRN